MLTVSMLGFFAFISTMATSAFARNESGVHEYEFGRKTSGSFPRREPEEADVIFRELLELESFSMSLSMSMPSDPVVSSASSAEESSPTIAPTATVAVADSVNSSPEIGCDEQPQATISIPLEVETASGRDSFTAEVRDALLNALSIEYQTCGSGRRNLRKLEDLDILLEDISVFKETGTCTPSSPLADKCEFATAEISVSGGDLGVVEEPIQNSVQSIVDDDQAFDEELLFLGIVDVRVRDSSDGPRSVIGSGGSTGTPATTAVVSVAAGAAIVLAALAFRRSRRKEMYADLDEKEASEAVPDDLSQADTFPATHAESTSVAF